MYIVETLLVYSLSGSYSKLIHLKCLSLPGDRELEFHSLVSIIRRTGKSVSTTVDDCRSLHLLGL